MLSQSKTLHNSLEKICDTKHVQLSTQGEGENYYSFMPAQKLFPLLQNKYTKVRKMMASKYLEQNFDLIRQQIKQESQPKVIKQEAKGQVKTEVKNE